MTRRIRTIKPDITESQSLARCSPIARLAFVYLITNSDDHGRMRGTGRMLGRILFPCDDEISENFDAYLVELENEGCIRRYEVEKSSYLEIVNWAKHQRIDKPKPSKYPAFPKTKRRGHVQDASGTNPRHVQDASTQDLDLDLDHGSGPGEDPHMVAGATVSAAPPNNVIVAEVVDPFDTLWSVFPKRNGSNPKKPAAELFDKLVRHKAVDPDEIVAGAERYAVVVRKIEDRSHIKQLKTWLNQECWKDDDVPVTGKRNPMAEAFDQLNEAIANGFELPPRSC